MHEIGKVYNYQGEGNGVNPNGNATSAANIKIQNQRKNQQVSQSLTRAQIKDATKRSATGGTGNIMTPHTAQLQTIQHQQNANKMGGLLSSGSNMIGMAQQNSGAGGVKNMRTLQPPSGTQSNTVNVTQSKIANA